MSVSQSLIHSIEQFRAQASARSRYWVDAVRTGWGDTDNDAYAQAMANRDFADGYQAPELETSDPQLEFFAPERLSRPPALFLPESLMLASMGNATPLELARKRRAKHRQAIQNLRGSQMHMQFQLRLF